jgi:peptidoglycan/xylan/chitin deacetylase (PgdA/CDA1 family)
VRPKLSAGSRAAARAFALLAALAPVLLAAGLPVSGLGSAGDGGGHAGARRATPAAAHPSSGPTGSTAPASQARYRIVGCSIRGGAVAYRHGPSRREVAIGFDDGPWRDTGAFVRMLERSHARATFFMIGRQLGGTYRATLLRELRDGDALGDHSFSHPDLTRSGQVYGQLRETIRAIRSLTGYTPCVFRPPYGAYDESVLSKAHSLGLATVLWSVDPRDWARPGTAAIERGELSQVRPGSIIISHDGGGPRGQTLAAYPTIIAVLRARGYRIVTIPELLGLRPVYVPCMRLCDGLGVTRDALPRDALLRRAP